MFREIETLFLENWWIILFCLITSIALEVGLHRESTAYSQLNAQYTALLNEKDETQAQQDRLQRQINSQSDAAWIELTLMKGLGLVPEGQTKVLFTLKAKDE